jgi:gliding motility-associated-like protein
MYPVSTWGKQFVTAPFAKMPYDIFRILASKDNTTVAVQTANTTLQYKLNKGQFAEYQQTEASLITASQPVAVAQYLIGSGCSGYPIGDPSILLLNSVEQIRDTVTLYNSSFENIQENYINIVTKTIDYPLTTLDNQPLDTYSPTLRIVGNDSLFTIASVKLNAGTHTILSRGCGIIASAYGYGPVESYAYGGGASFKAISANSLIPPGGCLPDTLLFDTRLTPPRHSFRWDLGDGTSSNEATFRHYYGKLGTFKVKLYLTDNCLNRTDTLERDVKITLRQAATVGVDPAGCVGESAEFFATDIEGATYQWSGPNNFASQQQYPIIDNLNSEMAGTYQVVGSVSGCETFPAFNTLTVYPLPSPQLGNDTLTCSANFFPLLYLNPGSFSTYIWQNNSGNNTFTVVEAGDYWVEVTDLNGCQNRDSVAVFEQCPTKYYAPNVFSPDGDGLNDYFSIEGTDIRTLTLHIFDRWGNKVFSSTQTDAKWDGYIQGEKGPPGVYVWVARIGGYLQDASQFEKTDSGNVTLVR